MSVGKRSKGGVPGHPTAREGEAEPANETSEASEKEGAPGQRGPPGAERGSYCRFLRESLLGFIPEKQD